MSLTSTGEPFRLSRPSQSRVGANVSEVKIDFEWTRAFAKSPGKPAYEIANGRIQQIGRGKQRSRPSPIPVFTWSFPSWTALKGVYRICRKVGPSHFARLFDGRTAIGRFVGLADRNKKNAYQHPSASQRDPRCELAWDFCKSWHRRCAARAWNRTRRFARFGHGTGKFAPSDEFGNGAVRCRRWIANPLPAVPTPVSSRHRRRR